jgi:hypothetical protein
VRRKAKGEGEADLREYGAGAINSEKMTEFPAVRKSRQIFAEKNEKGKKRGNEAKGWLNLELPPVSWHGFATMEAAVIALSFVNHLRIKITGETAPYRSCGDWL